MSVRAPPTSPPVQDSAVAIVSLRIRQRSSSERERARASPPLMSVAPALLATGKAEPLAGGGFHCDAGDFKAGDFGNTRPHGVTQRSDFRAFANHRHFEIADATAARGDAVDGIFQKAIGGGVLPLHV